jgi:hypothetical protein
MSRSKLIPALLLGLLLLAAGAFAALLFVDPALFRSQLEARATEAFGREVRLAGPIRLERSLTPRLVAREITIANPEWAVDPAFATAEEIAVQVALLPLLRGDLRVLDIRFSGVEIFLESRPDGAAPHAFGDSGAADSGAGALPPIERILIRNASLSHRSLKGVVTRYKIHQAQLWNLPGEPERIEAEGSIKEVPFRIHLAADTPAEATGPHLPWSARLELQCPDLFLTASGRVARVFDWEHFDLRIVARGDRPDSIQNIFDIDLHGIGAFEIAGAVEAADGVYRVKELAATVQKAAGRRDLTITHGTAAAGRNTPSELALQGALGDVPLSLALMSERPLAALFEAAAWPLSGRVGFAGAELEIDGTASKAGARLDLKALLRGENLGALARALGQGTLEAGSFRISSRAALQEGGWEVADLEGEIHGIGPWKRVRLAQGRGAVGKTGSISASLSAELDQHPLSLAFQVKTGAGPGSDGSAWPFELDAAAAGAELTAAGSIVDSPAGRRFEAATRIAGRRLDRLGLLIGLPLPRIDAYDLSARVTQQDRVHDLRDLSVRIGGSRLTGSLRWDGSRAQPLLTGNLSVKRLMLEELQAAAAAPAAADPLDRPIAVDWLRSFDARLKLDVNGIAGSPVPIEQLSADVTVAAGRLDAGLRGRAAGASLQGQVELSVNAAPEVSLTAAIGPIDAGRILRQLNLPLALFGAVKSVHIKGRSAGRTPRALLEQAQLSVRANPDGLKGSGTIVRRQVDMTLAKAEASVRRGQPAEVFLSGTLNRVPFDATIAAGSMAELYRPNTPLPVRLAIRAGEVRLKAEGAVARPFSRQEFHLSHELSGKEIKGLDPLMDMVLPLQGEFQARGHVSARGQQFFYEEDLRVGSSDLKAELTVGYEAVRPAIAGRVRIHELHMHDLILSGAEPPEDSARQSARVIPDHPIPAEIFRAADLDLHLQAGRIVTGAEPLGDLTAHITIQNGRYHSVHSVSGVLGGRMEGEVEIDAAADPLSIGIRFQAEELDYRFLQSPARESGLIEGRIGLYAELAGAGGTVRDFLADAQGRLTLIGGPGRISDRRLDLWAADLLPTMLSPRWQRENITEMNCAVAHVKLHQGMAEVEDILLDTRRITVAGSGSVDLRTESMDLLLAPRPKRVSLVSLANPVRIRGTLAEPDVSAARLPSRRRMARTGFLAGLVNPLFLLTAFVDTGTGSSNPCVRAVERAQQAIGVDGSE